MLRKIDSHMAYGIWHIVKELFLCLLSAFLLVLSFPNFNLGILAWVGFVPLFFALKNKSKTKAFLFSYLTGIIFWFGTIYWLIHVTLPGMIILVLYLALYFGIFGLFISSIQLLSIPSIWVLLEYIRSHLFTGFPWALLGYSQYLNLPVIQIADITGIWGVSFLVMMINVGIYSVVSGSVPIGRQEWSVISRIKKCLFPILCVFIVLAYGYYKLHHRPSTIDHRPIKISVIQGNIPQELKWDIKAKDFILDKYFILTTEALKDKPDLIIWPEAALPFVLEEEPFSYEELKAFVKENKTPLLLGAVTTRNNLYPAPRSRSGVYYNSALLISAEGKQLNKYDKLHLVPFGEYIPLRKILGFLETVVPIGDFAEGKEYTVFNIQHPFSVLICFEDLFPHLSREFTKRGAKFLVNITNDAWFKKTSSPWQHLQASVFRAVENRLPVIRAANTGVSGFIAPSGRIISLIQNEFKQNIFIDGYKTKEIVIPERSLNLYTRYGDIFIILCLIFSAPGVIRLFYV